MSKPMSVPVEMVQTKWGWMMCPPGDKFVTGSFKEWGVYSETEVILLNALLKHDSSVLIIGGNIGAVAVPLGYKANYVLVYEPQPLIFELLKANVGLAGVGEFVEPVHGAVGGEGNMIKVPVVRFDVECNMGAIGKEHWGKGVDVRLYDINQVLENNSFDLMIVDAEGMELEILQAVKDVSKLPEKMWVECDREAEGHELIDFIDKLGYNSYWMINPLTPNGVRPDSGPWAMQSSFNLLCLKDGVEWPFPGLPQFKASSSDAIGNCTSEKLIWSINND